MSHGACSSASTPRTWRESSWVSRKLFVSHVNTSRHPWKSLVTISSESASRTWRESSRISCKLVTLNVNRACHARMSHVTHSTESASRTCCESYHTQHWECSYMNGPRQMWILVVGHATCVFEQTELTAKLFDYFLLSNKININQWTISHTELRAVHELEVSYHESHMNGPCHSWKSRATCDLVTAHTTVRALHELDINHPKSSMRREVV